MYVRVIQILRHDNSFLFLTCNVSYKNTNSAEVLCYSKSIILLACTFYTHYHWTVIFRLRIGHRSLFKNKPGTDPLQILMLSTSAVALSSCRALKSF